MNKIKCDKRAWCISDFLAIVPRLNEKQRATYLSYNGGNVQQKPCSVYVFGLCKCMLTHNVTMATSLELHIDYHKKRQPHTDTMSANV